MKFEIGQEVFYRGDKYIINAVYVSEQEGCENVYKAIYRSGEFFGYIGESRLTPVIEKWEPKKGGESIWFIDLDSRTGGFYENLSSENYRLAGLERETKEQAERALERLRKFSRLSAWVDEFVPDSEFEFTTFITSAGVLFRNISPGIVKKIENDIKNGFVEL